VTGKPLADAQGQPLLPRVAQALADGATLPSPTALVGQRERSALDAGASYSAIDPELLAAYQARGRRLQSVAVGEGIGAAFLWLGARLAALGRDLAQPSPATVPGAHARSALDAGALYPAIDPGLSATYQARGRHLQSVAMGEGLGAAFLWLGTRLATLTRGMLGEGNGSTGSTWRSPDEVERLHDRARKGALDLPEDYAQRVSRFYGRGL
jgi:hypothetical protein